MIRAGAAAYGWFDVSTLREPYRAEGKKTMGLELAEQLGWTPARRDHLPDRRRHRHRRHVEGVRRAGGAWAGSARGGRRWSSCRPRAARRSCAPSRRAQRIAEPWADAQTIAAGLRVPAAIGDYLILEAVRESGGTALTVTDDEMLEGMALAAEREGLFVSPESGAAVIATRKLRESGFLRADDLTVIFATGSGLMHVDLVDRPVAAIDPNEPDLLAEIAAVLSAPVLASSMSRTTC